MNLLRSVLAVLVTLAVSPPTQAQEDAAQAFVRLQALVGTWEARTPQGKTIKLGFQLLSNDSALVETFTTASGRQTMTVYHLAGPSVMATHYCAQGNQPRLQWRSGAEGKKLIFTFADATNLTSPAASHLHRLEVELVDKTHFRRVEVYLEDGKEDVTEFQFVRTKI